MKFFFSLDWLGAVFLLILIMCGLAFDGLTPFFETLYNLYPIIIIIAILSLVVSTAYYIYIEENSIGKGLMCAFCKTHMMFFGLSVPYEILYYLASDEDPFSKMLFVIPVGLIFYAIYAVDNVVVMLAMLAEEKSMAKMGIVGVIGWILCYVLLF